MDYHNVDLFFPNVDKMLTPKSDQQMAITQLEKVFTTSWELVLLEPSHNIQNLNPNQPAHHKNKTHSYPNCKFTSEIFFIKNSTFDLRLLLQKLFF